MLFQRVGLIIVLIGRITLLRAEEVPRTTGPKESPIVHQSKEKGEEYTWGVESVERREVLYPSNWGQVGIFRVRSAESLPQGTLAFGVGGEFYSIRNAPDLGVGDTHANTIAESLFVGFSPANRLTIGIMRRNSSTTFGNPQQLISSLGDFNFSGLYSFPIDDNMAFAPIANILIASNFNNLAPAGSTLSAGFGGAFTYGFYHSMGIPFFAHANLLYYLPQIRTTKGPQLEPETYFNFSRYHTLTLGLGAEYKMGDFIPFIEYEQTWHTNSSMGYGRAPSRASFGSRFTPLENKSLAFLLGMDIGIIKNRITAGAPFSPDYQVLGQVSYTVGITNTERKHYFTTADVNVVDRKFVIRKNINFKVGSYELEPDSASLLDQIAQVIRQNDVRKLLIVGHTDSTHTEDYNLKLSIDRANSVKRYLVSRGISEDILMAQGYGKRRPRASNLSEAGRSLNRRVEFFILE